MPPGRPPPVGLEEARGDQPHCLVVVQPDEAGGWCRRRWQGWVPRLCLEGSCDSSLWAPQASSWVLRRVVVETSGFWAGLSELAVGEGQGFGDREETEEGLIRDASI